MTRFQAFPYRKPNELFSWSNDRSPDSAETPHT
jgi:hypothetical protein